MSGLFRSVFGSGETTSTTVQTANPPTQEELELIRINTELARRQLANIDALVPFQRELLDLTMADLRRQGVETAAFNAAISPEEQAAFQRSEFARAQRLGPIQDELLNLQLEQLRTGGAATPEQLARIKTATDAAISAGSGDIDDATRRGIGLIADELANSRGLRLSDSPISSEAALLAREGQIQKGSLTRNLRAGEASAALNFPLAVQQVQSGINLGQQNLTAATQNFQAQLRQQATINRLALTGQTAQSGIGLAGLGGGVGASTLGSLTSVRGGTQSSRGFDPAQLLQGHAAFARSLGPLAGGIGAAMASDRRLKDDYGIVAETKEGIPLHLFKYKGEDERDPLRFGVMADEVEKVRPEAVKTHSSGYKVVRYDKLSPGIGLAA